jgi:uncharacterized protein (DUF1697 family)
MKTYVILLRGVMPTGKNKVPMAYLRAALAHAGLQDTQTYIQSGNVVAKSGLTQGALELLVHDVIKKRIGADIAVIARPAERFREVLENNPFRHADTARLYFSLLRSHPEPKLAKAFLATDFGPDQIRIVDGAIYALYATKLSDSKFVNNFFERKLKVIATTRNFNTVTKLVELSSA